MDKQASPEELIIEKNPNNGAADPDRARDKLRERKTNRDVRSRERKERRERRESRSASKEREKEGAERDIQVKGRGFERKIKSNAAGLRGWDDDDYGATNTRLKEYISQLFRAFTLTIIVSIQESNDQPNALQ